jgi:hypothetical protein
MQSALVTAGVRDQVPARASHVPLPGASVLAWGMFAVVLLGFTPTFVLRGALGKPPLAPYLALHGFILFAWYAMVAMQTTLLVGHRYSWHRKLGWGAAVLGVAVFASSAYNVSVLGRQFAQRVAHTAKEVADFNFIVAASYASIFLFLLFMLLAIVFRKQRTIHGRLMLLASVSLIGPAITRIAAWFGELPNAASALILLLPVALCLRDFLTEGRVHRVTILGIVSIFAATFILTAVKVGDLLVWLYRS